MADLGVLPSGATSTPFDGDLTNYEQPLEGLTLGSMVSDSADAPAQFEPLTNYRIAGTISGGYHPPIVGQIWPRGDLDAIDPN